MTDGVYFPDFIWKEIISYLPIKKRFTFDKNKETELHKIFNSPFYSYFKLKKLVNSYLLTENNYLCNKKNNTPLHIACMYYDITKNVSILWGYYYLKRKCPEMNKVKNIHNKLPYYFLPIHY